MKNDITSDNSEKATIESMNDQRSNQDEWMIDYRIMEIDWICMNELLKMNERLLNIYSRIYPN